MAGAAGIHALLPEYVSLGMEWGRRGFTLKGCGLISHSSFPSECPELGLGPKAARVGQVE